MLKKLVFAATVLFISAIIFEGCVYSKGDEKYPFVCDTTNIRYSVEITAILNENCQSCHYSGNTISYINLYDYETIHGLALDGQFTYGTLLAAVMHEDGLKPMPQPDGAPKLLDCDINKIAAWVRNGAPNN
jgi:hypothetical protein